VANLLGLAWEVPKSTLSIPCQRLIQHCPELGANIHCIKCTY